MINFIIVAILIIIVLIGFKESAKHFRGEGGCCGGSSSRPKKKRLNHNILCTYLLHVEGMHCQNCADNITRSINDIEGAAASVNLRKHEVKVICDRKIDFDTIKNAIERRGYQVVDYKEIIS